MALADWFKKSGAAIRSRWTDRTERPDEAVDLRSLAGPLGSLAGIAGAALRAYVGTILGLGLAGCVLAGVSYFFLRDYPWYHGTLAAAVALGESVVMGFVLGSKQALTAAVSHALGELRLGRTFVGRIFERMLGVAEGEEVGERGSQIARGLERLPLARAEELLSGAVRGVMGDTVQGGWFRRKIQALLLETIRKFTLTRFRTEAARHGGVDLLKVKEELEQTVDDALVRKVRQGLRFWTILVIVGLPLLVALQTWLFRLLPPPQ